MKIGVALSNSSLLLDIEDNLLFTAAGIFLIIEGGVVALAVDVKRCGIWFYIWSITGVFKVHGDV